MYRRSIDLMRGGVAKRGPRSVFVMAVSLVDALWIIGVVELTFPPNERWHSAIIGVVTGRIRTLSAWLRSGRQWVMCWSGSALYVLSLAQLWVSQFGS